MAQIIVHKDLSGMSKPEVFQLTGQVNLLDWLCDNQPLNFGDLHCSFTLNGVEICNTWDFKPEYCNNALDVNISGSDCAVCAIRPAAELTIGQLIAIVFVAAAISIALTPKLNNTPIAADNDVSQSNQLNSSQNTYLKIGDAVDDNAGQIVKTPKFLQRSYYEYNAIGRRVFTEYFLIGRGQYDCDPPKEAETPFDLIPGYEYEYLPPGSHPSTLLNVVINPSTQDVDILSQDQQTNVVYPSRGSVDAEDSRISIPAEDFDALNISVGTVLDVNLECRQIDFNFFISGTFTVTSVDETIVIGNKSFTVNVTDFADSGFIESGYIANTEYEYSPPSYIIGDANEVWVSIVMPQGIRKGDGTNSTVSIVIRVDEIDSNNIPTGVFYLKTVDFYGNTQSRQSVTRKITSADGLPSFGRYMVQVERITPDLGDNALDLVVLEYIAAVREYAQNWGDITALKVVRESSQRVNKGASTKINCLVTRKLQTFTSGSTYVATRNFSDYAYYLLSDLAQVSDANIDTTTLFGIMSGLSSATLGYFDYQFDDKNTSLRDRLNICCNVARVRYYNEGLNWTFTREEARPTRMALFNRRNLKPQSSQFVQQFRRPNDYDGVTLVYVDPVKNSEKRISKKILGGDFVDGLGENSFEFNLAGCRNAAQAINRLNLEVRRLIYQNIQVKDVSKGDALTLPLGERVDWVDMYDHEIFSGEIMGQRENVFATSERFTPQAGVDYLVCVTDDDGVPTSTAVACSPRSDGTIKGFEAEGLFTFTGNQVFQVGSRYMIASANNYEASSFTLIGKGKPNEDGDVPIELAEYNELLFADD